jgi:hypothetical protein
MEIEPIDGYNGLFLVRNVYDSSLLDEFLQEDFDSYPREMTLRNTRHNINKFPANSKWKELLKSADYSKILKLGYITGLSMTMLWIDESNFKMTYHVDNDMVVAGMQVYLKSNEINCGTTFIKNDVEFTVPYKKNCGYLSLNHKHKLVHGVSYTIEEQRYSTFTRFKNWKKFI